MVNAYYLKDENEGLLNKTPVIVIPQILYHDKNFENKNDPNETTLSNILPD